MANNGRDLVEQAANAPAMETIMPTLSRRDAIKSLGGAVVAGACGLGTQINSPATIAKENSETGSLIDTHVHIVSSRLYRMDSVAPLTPPFHLFHEPGGAARL